MDFLARKKIPYFKRPRDISDCISIEWEHVDLFFIRETSQKNMKNKVFERGKDLNEFGRKQLNLSKCIIEESKPKLIVVANALASHLFIDEFSSKFDENKGCHYIDMKGSKIPVFLCSMLSGQRALDNFSYDWLKWHIKKVIK